MERWLAALILLFLPCAEAMAEEKLTGQWRGGVNCVGQPEINVLLTLKEASNGKFSGEAAFRRGSHRAVYALESDGVRDNRFVLRAGKQTQTSLRIPAADFNGEFFSIGGMIGIHGKVEVCNRGLFSAYRQPDLPDPTAKPPVAARGERDFNKLATIVRQGVSTLLDRRDQTTAWWRSIELSIVTSRVDVKSKEALLAEVKEARANLFADALLEKELKAGPMTFPEGVGRALFVFRTARAKKDWPDSVKLRVYKECQKRVADVMRPELQRIAAGTNGIPTSLDGLTAARAELNRIDTYKASLEDAFGTVDQENILSPMRQRIAALEASPVVLEQLRRRLDGILEKPNPSAATDRLFLEISGFEALSPPLAAAIRDGQKRAALAEIVVDGEGVTSSRFEPSAKEIAHHVFSIVERENERLARKRCQSRTVHDPWTWAQCFLGETRLKLNRVAKHKCVEVQPEKTYTCYFDQETVFLAPGSGKTLPDLSSSTSAIFNRPRPGAPWHGSELGMR